MKQQFWGYGSKTEAQKVWPSEILDTGKKTTKIVNVVVDPTKWPQTSSETKVITRIELPGHIISY